MKEAAGVSAVWCEILTRQAEWSVPLSGRGVAAGARSTEGRKSGEIAGDQRILLGPGPVLELGFALPGLGKRRTGLNPQQSRRRVKGGGPAGATGDVVVQPLFEVDGSTDVGDAGSKTEDVDHRCDPGNGRSEAAGFGEQGVHGWRVGEDVIKAI